MCLEEMLCCTIPEGALYYGETRRRLRVSFSEELRREVRTCNPLSFSPCPAANRNSIIKMLRMVCEKRILSAQYRLCICVYLLSLPHGERGLKKQYKQFLRLRLESLPHGERGLKKDRLALHMAGPAAQEPGPVRAAFLRHLAVCQYRQGARNLRR